MEVDYATPPKFFTLDFQGLDSRNSSSFSSSTAKNRLSERRYTMNSEADIDEIRESMQEEEKAESSHEEQAFSLEEILTKGEQRGHHRKQSSHHRQKSIYFDAETPYDEMLDYLQREKDTFIIPSFYQAKYSKNPKRADSSVSFKSHARTISDADSVVYAGPGDDSYLTGAIEEDSLDKPYTKRSSPTICSQDDRETRKNTEGTVKDSCEEFSTYLTHDLAFSKLPVLGEFPCAGYCFICKLDVHTVIDYNLPEESRMSLTFVRLVSPLLTCCQDPKWLSRMRVHKCSVCGVVIAKGS